MTRLFSAESFARLSQDERGRLMVLQMSPSSTRYGGGGYLPEDCSECGACGEPILGSGWCDSCDREFDRLVAKATGGGGD